jgi:hypothetical protein
MPSGSHHGHRRPIAVEPDESGCWVCVSHPRVNGYPVMKRNNRTMRIHRHVFEMLVRPLLPGEVVRHSCDKRSCLNPWHLLAGTNKQNSEDMVARGRQAKGENHHSAKLTEEQVLAIYQRRAQGSIRQIAMSHGVSMTVVKGIRNGAYWRWLTQGSIPV